MTLSISLFNSEKSSSVISSKDLSPKYLRLRMAEATNSQEIEYADSDFMSVLLLVEIKKKAPGRGAEGLLGINLM